MDNAVNSVAHGTVADGVVEGGVDIVVGGVVDGVIDDAVDSSRQFCGWCSGGWCG